MRDETVRSARFGIQPFEPAGDQRGLQLPQARRPGGIEAGELRDPLEAVVDGVGMHVQRARRELPAEIVRDVRLEGLDEFRGVVERFEHPGEMLTRWSGPGELILEREVRDAVGPRRPAQAAHQVEEFVRLFRGRRDLRNLRVDERNGHLHPCDGADPLPELDRKSVV